MSRDVIGEADVPVGSPSDADAVDPDVAVHVDAIELEPCFATARWGGQGEGPAIPADACGEVADATGARGVLTGDSFHTPVVGHIERPPRVIIERSFLGATRVAQGEPPGRVDGE